MPDETTQPEQSANLEPASSADGPISVPPEPAPVVPTVLETPTMPPVAVEASTSPVGIEMEQMAGSPIPATEPPASSAGGQNPPPAPPSTTAPAPQPVVVIQQSNPRSFLAKALEKIQFRKRAKLEKIVKLAMEKKSITNDQVQKLLYVSDATASRYLLQLTKEDKLEKVGPDGRARYEPL